MNSPYYYNMVRLAPSITTCKIPAFAVASHPQAILLGRFQESLSQELVLWAKVY